ncbi:MAG: WG repeat-containing protein [Chitinophagaceae bacterium]
MMRIFFTTLFILSISVCLGQKRQISKIIAEINEGQFESAGKNLDELELKEGKIPEILFTRYFLLKTTKRSTDALDAAYSAFGQAFSQLQNIDIKDQEKFCKDFNFCSVQRANLEKELQELIFDAYSKSRSKELLLSFQKKYPENSWITKSQFLVDSIDYAAVKDSKDLSVLTSFIKEHKQSQFTIAAQESIFKIAYEIAVKNNSISAFEDFISRYGNAPQLEDAKKKLVDLVWIASKRAGGKADLEKFIKTYPSSAYTGEAKILLENMAWAEAEKLNTANGYKEFAAQFPGGEKSKFAMQRYDELRINVFPFLTREKKYKLYDIDSKQFRGSETFDFISLASKGKFIVKKYEKFGVVDKNGESIIPITYNCIALEGDFYKIKLGDKNALYNALGKKVIDFKYDNFMIYDHIIIANSFSDTAQLNDYDIYDREGNLQFSGKYSQFNYANDTLFIAYSKGQGYLVNGKGKIISPRYTNVMEVIPGFFKVSTGNNSGLMDKTGKLIIPLTYQNIYSISSTGYFILESKLGNGIGQNDGSIILPPQPKQIMDLTGGMFLLKSDVTNDEVADGQLYNANTKKFIIPGNFRWVKDFHDGYALAGKNGKSGYINTNGEWIVNPIYSDELKMFAEMPMDGDESDYLDGGDAEECYLSLSSNYGNSRSNYYPVSTTLSFYDGLAIVGIESAYGYVDKTGEVKIPIVYDNVSNFYKGYANVTLTEDGKSINLVIDRTGKRFLNDAQILYFFDNDAKALIQMKDEYSILDLGSNELSLLTTAPGLSYLSPEIGYFTSTFKGESVIVLDDGQILKDRNIDFSDYDFQQSIYQVDAKFNNGEYDEAISEYKRLLSSKPNNYLLNYKIGLCYVEKDDSYNARSYLTAAVNLKPKDINDLEPLNALVEYNFKKSYWSDVVRDASILLSEENGDDNNLLFKRAYSNSNLGNYEAALDDYNTIINSNPGVSTEYNNRGVIYMRKNLYQQALRDFEKALQNYTGENDESIALYNSNKGNALFNLNRKSEACISWKKASSLGNTSAANNISRHCK